MLKRQVPIDPMDGLPDVPLMVEKGMAIHEAISIWCDFKTFHRQLQNYSFFQERPQSAQEPC